MPVSASFHSSSPVAGGALLQKALGNPDFVSLAASARGCWTLRALFLEDLRGNVIDAEAPLTMPSGSSNLNAERLHSDPFGRISLVNLAGIQPARVRRAVLIMPSSESES